MRNHELPGEKYPQAKVGLRQEFDFCLEHGGGLVESIYGACKICNVLSTHPPAFCSNAKEGRERTDDSMVNTMVCGPVTFV